MLSIGHSHIVQGDSFHSLYATGWPYCIIGQLRSWPGWLPWPHIEGSLLVGWRPLARPMVYFHFFQITLLRLSSSHYASSLVISSEYHFHFLSFITILHITFIAIDINIILDTILPDIELSIYYSLYIIIYCWYYFQLSFHYHLVIQGHYIGHYYIYIILLVFIVLSYTLESLGHYYYYCC